MLLSSHRLPQCCCWGVLLLLAIVALPAFQGGLAAVAARVLHEQEPTIPPAAPPLSPAAAPSPQLAGELAYEATATAFATSSATATASATSASIMSGLVYSAAAFQGNTDFSFLPGYDTWVTGALGEKGFSVQLINTTTNQNMSAWHDIPLGLERTTNGSATIWVLVEIPQGVREKFETEVRVSN